MDRGRLDDEGRLELPEAVKEALGWEPGDEIELRVDGRHLVAYPAEGSPGIREEARRLATAMRDLTRLTARQISEATAALARKGGEEPTREHAPGRVLAAFHGVEPRLGRAVFLADGCRVIGDVALGDECSVWPGAVIRGDVARVRVGARSNIQDGAVLHVSPQLPCILGSGVTVGHQAVVHACTLADDVLVGMHAVILDGAKIGRHCIVGAGAVVPPGMEVPPGKMILGVPGRVVRDLTPQEIERIHWNADTYVSLKEQYLRPDVEAEPIPPEPALRPTPPDRGALPRYECRRAAGEITVDGSLDDEGWKGIPPTSSLVRAQDGAAVEQETEVRACWDDRALYLAFSCKDRDIWSNFENRDDPLYEEEVVEFFASPTGDLRHYFELEVSPANVVFDARVFNPELQRRTMLVDTSWNAAGLRSAVRVSGALNDRSSPDIGWIAEIELPFADLGLSGPPREGDVWRVNFYRIERGEAPEFSAWSPTGKEPADFHVPDCFGELVFTR